MLVVGRQVGVLDVFLEHLLLRLLLRFHVFLLRLLLFLVHFARCAGVGLGARRGHCHGRQQEAETQSSENKDRSNSLHRFLWNLNHFTIACKPRFHYGSKRLDAAIDLASPAEEIRDAASDRTCSAIKIAFVIINGGYANPAERITLLGCYPRSPALVRGPASLKDGHHVSE